MLEIINMLSIGLASHNFRNNVASNIPINNHIIKEGNLKSQEYLEKIHSWSEENLMELNLKKTKVMVSNFTKNYKFTPLLNLNGENIQQVEETKLLGTHITSDLKWDKNTAEIVKKSQFKNANLEENSRIQT